MRSPLALAAGLLVVAGSLAAQEFAGTYTTTNDAGKLVTLALTRNADGSYAGTLSTDQISFDLKGSLSDTLLFGAMSGGGAALYFAAAVAGTQLSFFMIEPNAQGDPDFEKSTGFVMTRRAATAAPAPPPARGGNPLGGGGAPGADPYVGTFTDGSLTLALSGGNGTYRGTAELGGQRYPVQLNGSGAQLNGTFTANGQGFPLVVAKDGQGLRVTTGDATYALRRQGGGTPQALAPANPLGGGGRPAPAAQPVGGGAVPADMIGDRYAGYFFRPPAGWKAQQGQDAVLLGHNEIPGFIVVRPHGASSVQQLQAEAMQGLHEQGMSLMPVGMPQSFGANGIQAEYQGVVQGTSVKAYAVGLVSPHGGGIAILAMTESSKLGPPHKRAVEELARSVAFRQPEASPAAQSWDAELRGRKLKNLDSYYSGPSVEGGVGGGYSSETTIALCSNGEFAYWDSSTLGVGGDGVAGYGAGRSGAQGTWQIVTRGGESALVLNGTDGSVREYTLSWEDKLVHLNGNKFFRIENDICR